MGNKEYSISEVIDSFGLTKNTWTVFILLAFAMILDGYDFMIVNSTNLFVAHTFWPDNPNPGVLMGSLTTWGLLGMVIGGAIGGIVSDRIGRKKMLILAVVFYGAFTLPQAFANDLVFFAVFRLIAGLGVGSCIPIVTTMLSESVPSNRRGLFIGIGQACMVGGWVVAGLIANPICNATTPLLGEFTNEVVYMTTNSVGAVLEQTMFANWRLCYLIGGIPVIYGIVLHFAMLESPHWSVERKMRSRYLRSSSVGLLGPQLNTIRIFSSCLPSRKAPPFRFCSRINTSWAPAPSGQSTSSVSSAYTE
mgnify:CR=1 FL=1